MKKVHNLIILDESGSMECIREQALSGLNETLQTIINAQKKYPEMEQRTTVLLFDSENTKYVFLNEKTEGLRMLDKNDYCPNACTPLYDAIGKGISDIKKTFGNDEAAIVTIITDGYENASREYSLKQITKLIDKLKKKNWTFAFIGTDNLDVESMAENFHINNHLVFSQDEDGTRDMFVKENRSRMMAYGCFSKDVSIEEDGYFNSDDENEKDF